MPCAGLSCYQGRRPCTTPAACGLTAPDELDAAIEAAREGRVFWPLHRVDDFRTKNGGETVSTEDEPMSDFARPFVYFLIVLFSAVVAYAFIFD